MASFADAPAGDLAAGEKIFKTVSAAVLPSLAAAGVVAFTHAAPVALCRNVHSATPLSPEVATSRFVSSPQRRAVAMQRWVVAAG
jgi:hypothetical protein